MATRIQPDFLSNPLRLRLNHLFLLLDLSFPSELPSSPGLSGLKSSPGDLLLLLPLLKGVLLLPLAATTDLDTVNEEWTVSLCFSSSSTCFYRELNSELEKSIPMASNRRKIDFLRPKWDREGLPVKLALVVLI